MKWWQSTGHDLTPDDYREHMERAERQAERLPVDVYRIGTRTVDVSGMDFDELVDALVTACDEAVSRGEYEQRMIVCGRPASNVEMYAFSHWRDRSLSSLVDQFIARLLEWIGVTYE